MKLLWLLKRRYTAKDLLADRFGRYHRLPLALANHGIVSRVLALDYSGRPFRRLDEGGVSWESASWSYPALLARASRDEYDAVVGALDTFYCTLGWAVSARLGVPLVLDLSDDYEAFAAARFPFVRPLYRGSLRAAGAVACVSRTLVEKARALGATRVERLENAVDPPRGDREKARARFGLGADEIVFGYVGALHPNRGMATLYEAWPEVRRRLPAARLVIAGRRHRGAHPPCIPGMSYLGELDADSARELVSALDTSVVLTLPNAFGLHCDPVKLAEASAHGVPVVAARVGVAAERLSPAHLFEPGDAADLAAKMISLPRERIPTVSSWDDLAARYAAFLRDALPGPWGVG